MPLFIATGRRTFKARAMFGAAASALVLFAGACGTAAEEAVSGPGQIDADVPTMEQLYTGTLGQPPSTGPAPAPGKNVWWISCAASSQTCAGTSETAEEAAKILGWDLTVVDGKFNEGGAWSAAVRSAIAADADAIVLHGISCPQVQQALQEAKAASIPVLGLKANDCNEGGNGGPQMFDAGMVFGDEMANNEEFYQAFGRNQADYVIRATEGNARVITNAGTDLQNAIVFDAFKAELEKCSTCEIVGEVNFSASDLTPDGPWIQSFRSALIKNPNANAVYIPWGVMSGPLGGAQAVREAGLTDAIVFGDEGEGSSLQLVDRGDLTAIGGANPILWVGWAALDNLNRYFSGQEPVAQGIGLIVVDNEHNFPEASRTASVSYDATGVPWKEIYTKSWTGQP